jgi:hypothetical protein
MFLVFYTFVLPYILVVTYVYCIVFTWGWPTLAETCSECNYVIICKRIFGWYRGKVFVFYVNIWSVTWEFTLMIPSKSLCTENYPKGSTVGTHKLIYLKLNVYIRQKINFISGRGRMKPGSRFKWSLRFVLNDVRGFRLRLRRPGIPPGVRVPQAVDHNSRFYPNPFQFIAHSTVPPYQ